MELGLGIIIGIIIIAVVAVWAQWRSDRQRAAVIEPVAPPVVAEGNATKRRMNHAELLAKERFMERTSEYNLFIETFMKAAEWEGDSVGSDMDKYAQRLLREWEEHGKVIIGTDVDDTILPYKTATQAECDEVIELLKECRAVGAYIILFTCRNGSGIDEAIKYCESKGLHIDAANKNPPGVDLAWGHQAKPYANIFLDDRGHLRASMNRLAACMYRMRAKQWSERLDNPGSTEF